MGLRVTDYKVMADANMETLVGRVQKALGQGWQPLGCMMPSAGRGYMQTMVKYTNQPQWQAFGEEELL